MKILVAVLTLVSCVSLGLHIVGDTESAKPEGLTLEILANGLGYTWYPVDLESLGEKKMIGVGRSQGGGFKSTGGSSSRPENREEPMFVFYKIEDGELHYSLATKTMRLSGAIPIDEKLRLGTIVSTPAGTAIKAGTAFVTLGDSEQGASLPPDYEAGNVAFGIFAY